MEGDLIRFTLSLGAIALLVLTVHLLGFSAPPRLQSVADASDLFMLSAGGAGIARIAFDRAGNCAIARDASGRLLLLRPHGAQFVVEAIETTNLSLEGGQLAVCLGDSPKLLMLDLGLTAAEWVEPGLLNASAVQEQ